MHTRHVVLVGMVCLVVGWVGHGLTGAQWVLPESFVEVDYNDGYNDGYRDGYDDGQGMVGQICGVATIICGVVGVGVLMGGLGIMIAAVHHVGWLVKRISEAGDDK